MAILLAGDDTTTSVLTLLSAILIVSLLRTISVLGECDKPCAVIVLCHDGAVGLFCNLRTVPMFRNFRAISLD